MTMRKALHPRDNVSLSLRCKANRIDVKIKGGRNETRSNIATNPQSRDLKNTQDGVRKSALINKI